jgi:hypothetical protein
MAVDPTAGQRDEAGLPVSQCSGAAPSADRDLTWIKASASMGADACVEFARAGELIAVRDSKNADTPPLMYTRAEIAAFLDGAKKGEFDHLLLP